MPFRPFSRQQDWLFPPSLEELIPQDHPARFVAAFVENMGVAAWKALGIDLEWQEEGAPAYHPIILLCVWVYGFMTGTRSSRKLEAACRDQLPYLWLTGWQHPDHNTLWRFYKEHRVGMRKLFKRTVKVAVSMGLVDLALQAIDGSKVAGNASRGRTLDGKGLARLLERTEKLIAELEAQNGAENEPGVVRLPQRLARAEALREQVRTALAVVQAEEGPKQVNLTDPEAGLVKGRGGMMAGYNAQAAVSPAVVEKAGGSGLFITATEVVADSYDYGQTLAMLQEAEANTGQKAEASLLDAGYHSGPNLQGCREQGYVVLMAESQEKALKNPYHKDNFRYEAQSDSYICPEGQRLSLRSTVRRKGRPETRVYFAPKGVCAACPSLERCTKSRDMGRTIEVGPHEELLRQHRELMARPEAKALYSHRKELVEPAFGILKEQQGARRFLLRGLEAVRAEWDLLAAAFNLRTLFRVWRRREPTERGEFFPAMAG